MVNIWSIYGSSMAFQLLIYCSSLCFFAVALLMMINHPMDGSRPWPHMDPYGPMAHRHGETLKTMRCCLGISLYISFKLDIINASSMSHFFATKKLVESDKIVVERSTLFYSFNLVPIIKWRFPKIGLYPQLSSICSQDFPLQSNQLLGYPHDYGNP